MPMPDNRCFGERAWGSSGGWPSDFAGECFFARMLFRANPFFGCPLKQAPVSSPASALYLPNVSRIFASTVFQPPANNLFSSDASSPILTRIVQGLLSLLGVYAIIRFLPRLVSSFFKRFVFGLIGEILLVTIGTLLTERMTGGSDRQSPTRPGPDTRDRRSDSLSRTAHSDRS